MPVNFDTTVLQAGQNAFGVSITILPVVSQPNAPAYTARGVWSDVPLIIATGAGYHSTNEPKLSIRLSEFQVRPAIKDTVTINDPTLPLVVSLVAWTIIDVRYDGQGAAEIKLKNNLTGGNR